MNGIRKYALIVGGLIFFPTLLWGQINNQTAFRQLIEAFFQQNTQPIQQLSGEWPDNWRPQLQLDSSASRKITVGAYEIYYKRLSKSSFERNLIVPIQIQDSAFQSRMLTYTDSLSREQIRKIRRESPPALKGDAPGTWANTVRPLALTVGSIAAVVSLFYLRSR